MVRTIYRTVIGLLSGLALLFVLPVQADDDAAAAQEVVEKARVTFQNFHADPDMQWFRNNLGNARGVLIVPTYAKAGFIVGGAGGQGVLVTRNKEDGSWAGPAFYYMGAASLGLLAGVDVAEVLMLVMTDAGVDKLVAGGLKLGADVRVAAGPVGAGAAAATADVLAYSRGKGLYAGVSFDGSVINPREKYNTAFYGTEANTTDILIRRTVSNPAGAALLQEVAKAVEAKQ
jgi:lipid-binding SYLF domain-containing protein